MNTITITGNLVAPVEKIDLEGNKTLVNFRVGNNEYVNGESVSNGFFDVTAFGALAENIAAAALVKGERLIVTGRLYHSTFQREDGSTGGRTKIVATAVGLSLEFTPTGRKAAD